jgi:hypothetical protein
LAKPSEESKKKRSSFGGLAVFGLEDPWLCATTSPWFCLYREKLSLTEEIIPHGLISRKSVRRKYFPRNFSINAGLIDLRKVDGAVFGIFY